MKSKKETDYRTVDPQAVYELKKVALRLRRKGKEVKEICEITGLADKTVRMAFDAYDAGGINAIKPKKRGRKVGEKRCIIANWALNNNDLKQSIGTQAMVQDIQELQDNTSAFMGRLSGEPHHVKAYFDHPALTKYKLD